jgi:hypothetical protein
MKETHGRPARAVAGRMPALPLCFFTFAPHTGQNNKSKSKGKMQKSKGKSEEPGTHKHYAEEILTTCITEVTQNRSR